MVSDLEKLIQGEMLDDETEETVLERLATRDCVRLRRLALIPGFRIGRPEYHRSCWRR